MSPRLLQLLALGAVLSVLSAGGARVRAQDASGEAAAPDAPSAVPPVPWRDFGRAPFEEARREGKPVFLLLTAPWTWDHFLLPDRVFAHDAVRLALAQDAVPVRADVSVYPELRPLWSIRSGLVPSFHFLDADGIPLASFPPLGEEELLFYLGEHADPAGPAEREPAPTVETDAEFADGVLADGNFADGLADYLARALVRGDIDVAPPHREPDVALLAFLSEWAVSRGDRAVRDLADAEILRLITTPLGDPVDGGFHRAFATSDRVTVHHEKVLRGNAELGGLLATRFAATGRLEFGRDSLLALRFLNERLRTRAVTLYVGSMAADVFDPARRAMRLEGSGYYRMGEEGRQRVGAPPVSDDVPVGANWRVHQALAEYTRAYRDVRMPRAIERGGRILLAEGLEFDGSVRRLVGEIGRGNLRDQGDAGSGLLVYHGVTGDPAALAAAVRVADALVEHFTEGEALLDVARDADAPAFVRNVPPDPAFHGVALRFLADLSTVTGDPRWRELARGQLRRWATSVPADGRGAGELGRAALRAEAPGPLLVVRADPKSESGDRLRHLAYRLPDPTILVRWVAPEDARAAERFALPEDEKPAIWLVWGETSPALRQAVTMRRAWQRARERTRPAPRDP